jgi:hypothetical protein
VSITASEPWALSAGGKYLALSTTETFGDTTDTAVNSIDVYVIKTCMGQTGCTQAAKRISVDGIQGDALSPSFSADGTRIIYSRGNVRWLLTSPLTLP